MAKKFGKLYLDTDILRQFDFDIHKNPGYTNLKAKLLLSGIYIPRIVFEEWLAFYKDVLNGNLSGLKNKVDNINKYVDSKINQALPDATILEKELSDKMIANLKAAGIEIFENSFASIKLSTILDMAIHKIKPFKEDGRGFKDAIILFSIIEHCKYDIESEHFFLTGNKTDFDNEDVKNLISKEKIDLKLIFSIEDLNEYFDKLVNKKVKEWLNKRNDILRELLLAQKDKIIDFIRQEGQFNEMFLKEGFPFTCSIEKIKEIEFVDVLDPTASFLEDGQSEGDVEIYFKVKLRFNLSVIKSIYETPKFKIGEPVIQFTLPSRLFSSMQEMVVDKQVVVKGKIHIKMDGTKEQYSKEIKLEEISVPGSPLQKAILGLV